MTSLQGGCRKRQRRETTSTILNYWRCCLAYKLINSQYQENMSESWLITQPFRLQLKQWTSVIPLSGIYQLKLFWIGVLQTIYGSLMPEFRGKKTLRQTQNLENLGVTQRYLNKPYFNRVHNLILPGILIYLPLALIIKPSHVVQIIQNQKLLLSAWSN